MIYTIVLISMLAIAAVDYMIRYQKHNFKASGFLTFMSGAVLVLLSACRYQEEHSDFRTNYYRMIESDSLPWKQVIFGSNPGHAVFRKVIIEIFRDPQWYFFFSALLIVGAFMYAAKKYSPHKFISIFLFYTIGVYFSGNNVTRQVIALSITLFSWKYIIERKPWKFTAVILLACSFHISAVFFLPMYYLSGINFGKLQRQIYAVAGAVLVVFSWPVIRIFQRFLYQEYTGEGYGTGGSSPLRLLLVLVFLVFLYILVKQKKRAILCIKEQGIRNSTVFFNLLCHGTAIYVILSVLSVTSMLMFTRLAMYWSMCVILTLSYGLESSPTYNKKWLRYTILIVGLGWFAIMNYTGKLTPTPYTPFWEFVSRPKV